VKRLFDIVVSALGLLLTSPLLLLAAIAVRLAGPGPVFFRQERMGRGLVPFKMLNKKVNEGKGAALRDAWSMATGDLLLVQDADFEYDPSDYPKLLQPILDGKADSVFGSRFIGEPHRVMYFWHQVANNVLTWLSNMLTNLNLTDMEVCYKVFTREVYSKIQIKSPRFGVEPELTAKVARMRIGEGGRRAQGRHVRVYEVGVAYAGRTYEEGKKIGWKDAVSAIVQIIRFRFED